MSGSSGLPQASLHVDLPEARFAPRAWNQMTGETVQL
jgi:hypothetical protein